MSTIVRFDLPWGFVHATPWDRGANEGAVEWPPSPWRLLRAFYSAWCVHAPDLAEIEVLGVLGRLVDVPIYHLPAHTEAHTRHYYPSSDFLRGVGKPSTVKTFDARLITERNAALAVEWPVDLEAEETVILHRLVAGVRYLGRAESIVEATVVDRPPEGTTACVPANEETDGPLVRVLAPDGRLDVDALISSPLSLRAKRRLLPPATRWASYARARSRVPVVVARRVPASPATAVRIALSGAVNPARFEGVVIADLLRRAALKHHGEPSVALAGKDTAGVPLSGSHPHAHYLPWSQDGRCIDTLFVWAPGGLTSREVDALASIRHVWSRDLGLSYEVALLSAGAVTAVAPELFGPSHRWVTVTPYSPAANHRGDVLARIRADLNRELRLRSLPQTTSVSLIDGPWLQYRRYRPGKERLQRSRPAYGVAIEFSEPVTGPLALGQLSHFGLGLFRPRSER